MNTGIGKQEVEKVKGRERGKLEHTIAGYDNLLM